MASEHTLRLRIRTPHRSVVDREVKGVRLPTETGQVGLRARREMIVLVVEPGLLLIRENGRMTYASTAGGLLRMVDSEADLMTPYAVTGDTPDAVMADLEAQLAAPDSELAVRRRLGELEQRIMRELARRPGGHEGGAREGAR